MALSIETFVGSKISRIFIGDRVQYTAVGSAVTDIKDQMSGVVYKIYSNGQSLQVSDGLSDRLQSNLTKSTPLQDHHLVLVLDRPKSSSASDEEIRLSKTLSLPGPPGARVKIISAYELQFKHVILGKIQISASTKSGESFCLCLHPNCNKIILRKDMLISCEIERHCICASHFIPWNYDTHQMDMTKIIPYQNDLLPRIHSSNSLFKKTILGVLVAGLSTIGNSQQKEEFISKITAEMFIVCECCRVIDNAPNIITMDTLHRQIFPQRLAPLAAKASSTSTSMVSVYYPKNDNNNQQSSYSYSNSIPYSNNNSNNTTTTTSNASLARRLTDSVESQPTSTSTYHTPSTSTSHVYPYSSSTTKELLSIDEDFLRVLIESSKERHPTTSSSTSYSYQSNMMTTSVIKLLYNIRIIAENIRSSNKIAITLIAGFDYYNILKLICLRLNILEDDVILYRKDTQGWMTEISKVDDNAMKSFISIVDLRTNDLICVRPGLSSVGPRQTLLTLSDNFKFNVSMQSKVKSLEEAYCGWRSIRGDGNCYYRTVIFSLLEQIIELQIHSKFMVLYNKFQKITPFIFGNEAQFYHNKFLVCLQEASEERMWRTKEDLEKSFLSDNTLDLAAIRACRRLVSHYLLSNPNQEMNGLSVKDAILPSYPDIDGLAQYCHKYVNTMGTDAEGPLVDGGILLTALSCNGCIIFFSREESVPLRVVVTKFTSETETGTVANSSDYSQSESKSQSNSRAKYSAYNIYNDNNNDGDVGVDSYPGSGSVEEKEAAITTLHLLLRPGHYDMLYPHKDISLELFSVFSNKSSDELITPTATTITRRMNIPRVVVVSIYPLLVDTGVIKWINTDKLLERKSSNSDSSNGNNGDNNSSNEEPLNIMKHPVVKIFLNQQSQEDIFNESKRIFNIPNNRQLQLQRELHVDDSTFNLHVVSLVAVWIRLESPLFTERMHFIIDKEFTDISILTRRISEIFQIEGFARLLGVPTGGLKSITSETDTLRLVTYVEVEVIFHSEVLTKLKFNPTMTLSELEAKVRGGLNLQQDICMKLFLRNNNSNNNINNDNDSSHISDTTVNNNLNLLTDENISELLTNHEIEVMTCEVTQCKRNFTKECILQSCHHSICHDCLYNTISDSNNSNNLNPFTAPDSKDDIPVIKPFSCPVTGCTHRIQFEDVSSLPEYPEWESEIQSYRRCCFADIICDGERESMENFIQFNCSHFFHKDCITCSIRVEFTTCKQLKTPLICPECVRQDVNCSCPQCFHSPQKHILWLEEMSSQLGDILSTGDMSFLSYISIYMSTKDNGSKLFECKCGEFYYFDAGPRVSDQCPCGYKACLLCEKEIHPNKTCKEANWLRNRLECIQRAKDAGLSLQSCPKCDFLYGVPFGCQAAICTVQTCNTHFCYLCAAPREPILAHSQSYHRPDCDFYRDCCDKKCIQNGSQVCINEKMSDKCSECRDAGTLCIPPQNYSAEAIANGYNVLKLVDVNAEADRLRPAESKGGH
eukprot:gene4708-9330_t